MISVNTEYTFGKLIRSLFTLIFIVCIFVILCFHHAFHHHDTFNEEHKNCPVCVFLKIARLDHSTQDNFILGGHTVLYEIIRFHPGIIVQVYHHLYSGRAPPVFIVKS